MSPSNDPKSFDYDVFLGYDHQDAERVHRLAERLRAEGLRVWLDDWVLRPEDDATRAIEQGLRATRTLVLCLSSAAVGSDWLRLESTSALFRDPSRKDRRFVPLLLESCDVPETVRRFRIVDYRGGEVKAVGKLLAICKSVSIYDREAISGAPGEAPEPLAVLEQRLEGHRGWVYSVAVSPDSSWAASGSEDKTVKVWDLKTGECHTTLRGHGDLVSSIVVTPDGGRILSASIDKTIRVWEARSGHPLATLEGLSGVNSVFAMSDGLRALSGSGDNMIKLWDLDSGRCLNTFEGHSESVWCVTATTDGKNAISCSADKTLRYWDLEIGKPLATWVGHSDTVISVQITPDGQRAVSGSGDKTVKLWDLKTGLCVGTLEGHEYHVYSVAISPDGTLIASTGFSDKTLRLWDLRSGECLQVIRAPNPFLSVAFSPDGSRLVAGGVTPPTVYVYRLAGAPIPSQPDVTRRYMNAKVVLLGESGVGKSGLAHRLINDAFVQTDSTHGMQVWPLDLPIEKAKTFEREALLWDLAGQEDYRLIHQLFLDETALALMLINPQKDDPFAEAGDWLEALRAAVTRGDRAVAKLLIAARVDVGTVRVSRKKIDRFLEEHGFAAYLETSAKRGDACSDQADDGEPSALKRLIAEHIPWDTLPWTSTPRLLAELKTAVLEMTEDVPFLRFPELVQRLRQNLSDETFGESDVRTAVTLLHNHGLVMPFDFGDLVLLKPHMLNGYAAAVIRAARAHTDEIGCVPSRDVFECAIDFEGVDRLGRADEELLLRAMVQTFLDKSLCIAEDTVDGKQLIFPSQYRRERPIQEHPDVYVSYTFSGELATVYTTLVVRLWYSLEFKNKELWKDAAELVTTKGHTAGLVMLKTGEGVATLSVFFDRQVPDELKVVLIKYVHQHLLRYARDVERDRRYVCKCGESVTNLDAVRRRLAQNKKHITCQYCDGKVRLIDHIEQQLASDPVAREVLRMDEVATRELDTQALEQILIGHMMAISGEANQIFRPTAMFDYGIDGEVEFKDNHGKASGTRVYVQLKSGGSYLRFRKRDQKMIFDIPQERHIQYWTEQNADVYLVIRDAEKTIRWMNITEYLKLQSDKKSRQVVFDGEKLDAAAVWRARDRHLLGRQP